MSTRARQIIRLVARISVAGALLAWVFSQADIAQFLQTVRTARWECLLGVWGFTAAFFWLQSVALQWILRKQQCDVSTNTIFGASAITSLYGLVLPGIISTGIKWYILKRSTGKGTNVLSGMLYNQMTLTVVMMVIGLVGLMVTNPAQTIFPDGRRQHVLPLACGAAIVLIMLLSLLAVNKRTGGPVLRLLALALRPLPQAIRQKGEALLDQIATFQTTGWRFHLAIAGLNVADGLLIGLLIYLSAAWAARVVVPIGVLVWLCAIVFVLGKIPISIANLGVREVTLVGLLAGYGVGRAEALLMSMILFSSLIFMAAIGLVYWILWTAQARKADHPGEDSPA